MKYVSLHTHSTFSCGDGYGRVSDHVARVAALRMGSLALTEHGNVSSWVALEKACAAKGIKPIFGVEAYCAPPNQMSKNHMILLASNLVGLQNLNNIVTESWGTLGKGGTSKTKWATVHKKVLGKFNEGVIALSGCSDSELSCVLLGGKRFGAKRDVLRDWDIDEGVRLVQQYQEVFGDRYYLEVQRFPGLTRTCLLNPALAEISRRTGALLVATSDVHYPYPTQNAMQRILHAAHRGQSVEEADDSWEYDILLTYPQSDEEIVKDLENTGLSYNEAWEAVMNTSVIAHQVEVELPKAPAISFGVADSKVVLRQWITDGWRKRLQENSFMRSQVERYKARMQHEFNVIVQQDFCDYFLMVADIVQWAKQHGIAVGPGRGSSAGSLVCYLLSITEVDSLQYPMLFERFLDATRTDPPDIDIDFESDRRDDVFLYARDKYGPDRVANISTVTRYTGRNSLDDVARVYRVPSWKIAVIKDKLIERAEGHPRFAKTLEDTYNSFPEVASIVEQTPELSYAPRLEGNIRSIGVHAAGMVISAVPLTEVCALYAKDIGGSGGHAAGPGRGGIAGQQRQRDFNVIPFDKHDASYLGLLKIDALSLITMSTISDCCRMAGMKVEDLYHIPLDDEQTLSVFQSGDVLGVFQFEGQTTRRILKAVVPENIMEISDINALSRPGANDKAYIESKRSGGWEPKAHKIIEDHLSWTHGQIVYEEQILMILRDLGGFEPRELNRMRKIIHDKLGSTAFNEMFSRFVKGCAAHDLSEETARAVWDTMTGAAGYAFNIAHSVSYAHICYWSAYLKSRYPAEFFTASLLHCGDEDRLAKLVGAAELKGIRVEPPSLTDSDHKWTLTADEAGPVIVAGLQSIPGIGPVTAQRIIEWRGTGFGTATHLMEWSDLIEVKGIGAKTITKIKEFVEQDDPFGVRRVHKILDAVRDQISSGQLVGVPAPTHTSIDIPLDGELVCFAGILRKVKYYDAVEALQKRTAGELSREDGLRQISDPDKLKYVALHVEDEYGETVTVWVIRWKYPTYAKQIQKLVVGSDVIVVEGRASDFGGISIQADKLVMLES